MIGIKQFGEFNVMTAGVSWLFSIGGSLLPSIVGDVTRANADNNRTKISIYFSSSIAVLLFFSLISTVIFLFLFGYKENTISAIYIISILTFIFSVSDNIRQGLHENYINTLNNGISNLVVIVLVFSFYFYNIKTSILDIVLITLGSNLIFKFFNFLLVWQRAKLSFYLVDFKYCIKLIANAFGFVLLSLSYYINTAGILNVVNIYSKSDVGVFVLLQKISLILMGIIVMIRNPMWSMISKEIYIGGKVKVFETFRKILFIFIFISPFFVVTSYYVMPFIIYQWSGKTVVMSVFLNSSFSFYLTLLAFSYINSVMYYGMELFNKISKFIVFDALFNLLSYTLILMLKFDIAYVYLSSSLSLIVLNFFIYQIIKGICVGRDA